MSPRSRTLPDDLARLKRRGQVCLIIGAASFLIVGLVLWLVLQNIEWVWFGGLLSGMCLCGLLYVGFVRFSSRRQPSDIYQQLNNEWQATKRSARIVALANGILLAAATPFLAFVAVSQLTAVGPGSIASLVVVSACWLIAMVTAIAWGMPPWK